MPLRMPDPPTVAGYRVEEPLARGGRGAVWRGEDLASGRPVALKVLAGGGRASLTLRAEVAAAAALNGPHVVPVLDVRTAGDDAVLVTELAAGGTLADVLAARGRLAPPEAVTVLAPLGSVLADAHARLLVHGDLSPANVLFSAAGCPMLSDWGLARVVAELPEAGGAGTPGFTDPDVLAGCRPPDPPADVAALAAVGYAALAGRPPWRQGSGAARPALQRVAPTCPPTLATAIEDALAARPGDRPSAGEFAAAVVQACEPRPVTLPRRPTSAAAPPTLRRLAAPSPDQHPGQHPPSEERLRSVQHHSSDDHRGADQRAGQVEPAATGHRWWRSTDGAGSRPRGRPAGRTVATVLAAVVGLAVLAAVAGAAWSRHVSAGAVLRHRAAAPAVSAVGRSSPGGRASPAARPSPAARAAPGTRSSPGPAHATWQRVLQRLANRRATALRRRDATALDGVYAAGSPAAAADRATIARLRERGLVPRGLRITVSAVRPLPADAPARPLGSGTMAALEMVSTVSTYRLADAATGRTVGLAGADPRRAIRVRLRRTGAGWRIAALRRG